MENGGIAPRIFYLGTGWRLVVSFTLRSLYPRGKRSPVHQSLYNPGQVLRVQERLGFQTNRHSVHGGTVVNPTHRPPLPPGNIPGIQRLSWPQDHSAAGRIMSMKNSIDTIWNRTREVPACSVTR